MTTIVLSEFNVVPVDYSYSLRRTQKTKSVVTCSRLCSYLANFSYFVLCMSTVQCFFYTLILFIKPHITACDRHKLRNSS